MPAFILTAEKQGKRQKFRVEASSEDSARAKAVKQGLVVLDVVAEFQPLDDDNNVPPKIVPQPWTPPNDGNVYLDPVVAEMRTTELRKQRRGAISSCIVGSVLILVLGTTCSPFAVNQMLDESQRNQAPKTFGIVLFVVLAASCLWALAYTSKIRSLSRLISQIRTKPSA